MKKILFIGSTVNLPKVEDATLNQVSHKEGLLEFLSDDWDYVFCLAESKDYTRDKNEGWTNLLNDIFHSVVPKQKVFRVGFLEGGEIPLLRLPFSEEEFKKCLE